MPSICGYGESDVPYGEGGLTSMGIVRRPILTALQLLCRISTLISRLKASSIVKMAVDIMDAEVVQGTVQWKPAGIRSHRSAAWHLSLLPRSCDNAYGAKYRVPG
jgi:hypothetical protein